MGLRENRKWNLMFLRNDYLVILFLICYLLIIDNKVILKFVNFIIYLQYVC